MEFSKDEIFNYIQRAIHDRSGDDLERARRAFNGLSPEQMQENYGQSGRTRQEILDEYVRERALATAAMKFVCDRKES